MCCRASAATGAELLRGLDITLREMPAAVVFVLKPIK